MSNPQERPRVRPLDPPMVPFAVGGIVVWAVVGLVLLLFRDRLADSGHTDWLWICLAGFLWGFPGLAVMIRHDRRRRHRRGEAGAGAGADVEAGAGTPDESVDSPN